MSEKKGKSSGDGYYGSSSGQARRRAQAGSVERTESKRESARKQAPKDEGQAPRKGFLKRDKQEKEDV